MPAHKQPRMTAMLTIKCLRCGGKAMFESAFEAHGLPDACDFEFSTYCVKCRDQVRSERAERQQGAAPPSDGDEETRI